MTMNTPMIPERSAAAQSILRTLHAWLTDVMPVGYDTRDERLAGAYGIIATSAGEHNLPGATVEHALQMAIEDGLITATEAERYTGYPETPLAPRHVTGKE